MFIPVRSVHSGALGGSSGSFGIVGFILSRTWGGRVHSGWLGSFGHALRVVGLIRVRWVHPCAFRRSSGLFPLVGFTRARPGCRFVLSVHSDASFAWSGSLRFVGVIRSRSGVHQVYSG